MDKDNIAYVMNWDGEDDLNKDRIRPEDTDVLKPLKRVIRIYKNVTLSLKNLSADLNDRMVVTEIKGFNTDIIDGNLNVGILVHFFVPHYRFANTAYDILNNDLINEKATQKLTHLKAKHHFPKEDDALSKAVTAVAAAKNKTKAKAGRIEYPWTTMEIDNRERIVCVETKEEDGRIIRRLESALDVSLREIKRKNIAANDKNPDVYCYVRFIKKGMNMLTVTSLGKVLGPSSANREIKMACKRDGILPL
ncbi:hypothetical protein QBC46DRAFT_363717 [Diplogelasinospora grovesii]|uniref:Uncharacterized protein n=1 Tax=Diplogelasinospora grovesii TaxID=303347 RepID=A0AAN6N8W1_9PEZI|nr:hypothetical protein QBC46DRAFT_363717 [Diplogelasinospora grovesii]